MDRRVRNGNQPIAATHVFLQEMQERLSDRPWLAVTNDLIVPLNHRRDLHRAAKEQHLATAPRLGDRNVADLDACKRPLRVKRAGEIKEPKGRAARENVIE